MVEFEIVYEEVTKRIFSSVDMDITSLAIRKT